MWLASSRWSIGWNKKLGCVGMNCLLLPKSKILELTLTLLTLAHAKGCYVTLRTLAFPVFFPCGSGDCFLLWLSAVRRVLNLSKIVARGDFQVTSVGVVNLEYWVIALRGFGKLDSVCITRVNDFHCRAIYLVTASDAHLSLSFQFYFVDALNPLNRVLAPDALWLHPISEQLLWLARERNRLRNPSAGSNRRWKNTRALHVGLVVLAEIFISIRRAHF